MEGKSGSLSMPEREVHLNQEEETARVWAREEGKGHKGIAERQGKDARLLAPLLALLLALLHGGVAGTIAGHSRQRTPFVGRVQVCKEDAMAGWDLYLVDWGYNTAEERQRAAANPRITVIGVSDFAALLG
eukprot:361190-Chlamydomonas_euryale.AAC.2